MVKYKYDVWGNHAILDGNGDDLTSGVGVLNPFRYRSYYYDEETDLYYLQTRYYDPEVGRFLSQDDVSYLAPDNINGLNLYVYCSDNPVMATDPTGTEWWEALGKILIGVGVVFVVTALTVVTAGIAAVAIGASTAVATSVMSGALIGGLVAGGVNLTVQAVTKGVDNIDYGGLAISTFVGAVSGALSGGLGELSAGVSGGIKLLIHQGVQVGFNGIISVTAYIGQSIVTGSDITLLGLFTSVAGGFISGMTFHFGSLSSLFISLGIEFAGYVSDFYDLIKNNLKQQGVV